MLLTPSSFFLNVARDMKGLSVPDEVSQLGCVPVISESKEKLTLSF